MVALREKSGITMNVQNFTAICPIFVEIFHCGPSGGLWQKKKLWRWVSVGEAMGESVSQLPHAGMVAVRVWPSEEDWASHAASLSWAWGWRMSAVEKTAHTRFCLSSPLCPQGASLSWICLPPPACTRFNTIRTRMNGCINMILTHSHRCDSGVSLTCLGQRRQCSWTGPCSSASPELCALPSYWCIFFPAGPEPPWCSSASDNGHIHLSTCRRKWGNYSALKNDNASQRREIEIPIFCALH